MFLAGNISKTIGLNIDCVHLIVVRDCVFSGLLCCCGSRTSTSGFVCVLGWFFGLVCFARSFALAVQHLPCLLQHANLDGDVSFNVRNTGFALEDVFSGQFFLDVDKAPRIA